MRKILGLALLAALAAVSCAKTQASGPELKTDDQKTLYALGLVVSENLGQFNLSEPDLEIIKAGLSDGVLHR